MCTIQIITLRKFGLVYVSVCVCVHVRVHAVVCGAGGPWLRDIQLSYMINFQH